MNLFVHSTVCSAIVVSISVLLLSAIARVLRIRVWRSCYVAVSLALWLVAMAAFFNILPSLRYAQGTGVAPDEANARLKAIVVPSAATDVNFEARPYSGEWADFNIDEDGFRKLANSNGSIVCPFAFTGDDATLDAGRGCDQYRSNDVRYFLESYVLVIAPADEMSGLFFWRPIAPNGAGITGVYDVEHQRAYISYNSH